MQSVDGTTDNLFVLDTVHMASVDASKAFNTVSHLAIIAACERAGFGEYVQSLYVNVSTVLETRDVMECR